MFEFNATLLIAMISFVVFMFIMNSIFYRPILNIIKKRNDYIDSNYLDSKNLENKAKEYQDIHSKKIAQTQEQMRKEFKKEIENFNSTSNEKIEQAKAKTKQLIQNKKADLLKQEEEIKTQFESTFLNSISQEIVSKITK